jgi:hypothetical protein
MNNLKNHLHEQQHIFGADLSLRGISLALLHLLDDVVALSGLADLTREGLHHAVEELLRRVTVVMAVWYWWLV